MIKLNKFKTVLISILAALTLVIGIVICTLIPNGGTQKASADGETITITLSPDKNQYATTTTDIVKINVVVANKGSTKIGAVQGNIKYDNTVFSIGETDFSPHDKWSSDSEIAPRSGGIVFFSAAASNEKGDLADANFTAITLNFTVNKAAVEEKSYTFEIVSDKKFYISNMADSPNLTPDAAHVPCSVNFAAPSNNANLSSLTVDGKAATLSGSTYTVPASTYKFPYATTKVNIAATAADSGAKVTGTGNNIAVTWSGNTCTLTNQVTVTPASGAADAKQYTVVITRADPSTDMTGKLVLSGGHTATINLTPGTTSYTVPGEVPYANHKTVKFVASATSPTTVGTGCTINGTAATLTGNGSTPNLNKGANTIVVKIQAQDPSQSTTYTVTVNVGEPDLSLSSVKAGTFTATAQDANTYKVTVPYAQATGSLTVAATPTTSGVVTATIVGGASVAVGGTSKTVSIKVDADNGDSKTYTLNIEVGAADDTTSMSLTFSGALTNTLYLSDAQTNQGANSESSPVPYVSKDNVTITFTKPENAVSATAKIGSTSYTSGSKLALAAGKNELVVEVVSQGSVKTSTYKISIYVGQADTDASLKTVKLTKPGKSDVIGKYVNGQWEFDKTIAADDLEGWTLEVETSSDNTKSVVGAGSLTGKLSPGENPITVTVTPQDGAPQSHRIVIKVAESLDETDLDDIKLTANGVLKTLKQNKNEYSVTLSASESEDVEITATSANAQSKVSVNGGAEKVHTSTEKIPVSGKTTVNVVVISPDGSNRSLYTVVINVYTNDHDADPIGGFHVYAVQGQEFWAETEFLTNAIDPLDNSQYYSDMKKPFTVTSSVDTVYFNCILPSGATATIIGFDDRGIQISEPICADYKSGSTQAINLGSGVKFIGVRITSGDGLITKTTQFHFLTKEVKVKITGTDGKTKEFSSSKPIDWYAFSGGDRSNYTLTVEESSEYTAELVSYKTFNKEDSTDWEYNVGLGKGANTFVVKVTFNDGNVAYYACHVNNSTDDGTNIGLIVALIIFVVLFVAATVVMSVFIAKYVSQNKKYGYRD